MARIEKSYRNMAAEEVAAYFGDFPTLLQAVAKEELAKELRQHGVRPFTTRADGKINRPFTEAKRRVDFRFIAELSAELLKTIRREANRRSYAVLHKRSGALGREWSFALNGRRVADTVALKLFKPGDTLLFFPEVPYAGKAQGWTAAIAGYSITQLIARAMRGKRAFKDFFFRADNFKDGANRIPAVRIEVKYQSRRLTLGGP